MEKAAKTFYVLKGDEFVKVPNTKLKPVTLVHLPGMDDIELFVYNDKGMWRMVHLPTGAVLASLTAKEDLLEKVRTAAQEMGRAKLDALLAEKLKRGLSPRAEAQKKLDDLDAKGRMVKEAGDGLGYVVGAKGGLTNQVRAEYDLSHEDAIAIVREQGLPQEKQEAAAKQLELLFQTIGGISDVPMQADTGGAEVSSQSRPRRISSRRRVVDFDRMRERIRDALTSRDPAKLKALFDEGIPVATVIPALARSRAAVQWDVRGFKVDTAADAAALLLPLRSPLFESFSALYLDRRNTVIEGRVLTLGLLDASLIDPQTVLERMPEGTAAVILGHNHPSGDPSPSSEDAAVTRRVQAALQLAGVEVLDHVVTNDGFMSMRESGMLEAKPAYAGRRMKPGVPKAEQRGNASLERPFGDITELPPWRIFKRDAVPKITTPSDLTEFIEPFRGGSLEHSHIIGLDAKNRVRNVLRFPVEANWREVAQEVMLNASTYGVKAVLVETPGPVKLGVRGLVTELMTSGLTVLDALFYMNGTHRSARMEGDIDFGSAMTQPGMVKEATAPAASKATTRAPKGTAQNVQKRLAAARKAGVMSVLRPGNAEVEQLSRGRVQARAVSGPGLARTAYGAGAVPRFEENAALREALAYLRTASTQVAGGQDRHLNWLSNTMGVLERLTASVQGMSKADADALIISTIKGHARKLGRLAERYLEAHPRRFLAAAYRPASAATPEAGPAGVVVREMKKIYRKRLKEWFGGRVKRKNDPLTGQRVEVIDRFGRVQADDMWPASRELMIELRQEIPVRGLNRQDLSVERLQDWHDRAAAIMAENARQQELVRAGNTMRRSDAAMNIAGEIVLAFPDKVRGWDEKRRPTSRGWLAAARNWNLTQEGRAQMLAGGARDTVTHDFLYRRLLEGNRVALSQKAAAMDKLKAELKRLGLSDWALTRMASHNTHFNAHDIEFDMTDGERIMVAASAQDPENLVQMLDHGIILEAQRGSINSVLGASAMERKWILDAILASITPTESAVATAMVDIMTGMGTDGNEVSRRLFGKDLFLKERYFPRSVDREQMQTTIQSLSELSPDAYREALLQNIGLTKKRVKHKFPVRVANAFRIFEEHVTQMSNYIGMSESQVDLLNILGNPHVASAIRERVGGGVLTRIRRWALLAAGLRDLDAGWNGFQRVAARLERSVAVELLWGRASTVIFNRVGGAMMMAGEMWATSPALAMRYLSPFHRSRLPYVPPRQSDVAALMTAGYFRERWSQDWWRVAANLPGEGELLASSKSKLALRKLRQIGFSPMATAELKNAAEAYRLLRSRGMGEAEAVLQVELWTRATQNPSTAFEMTGAYEDIKSSAMGGFLMFFGQPAVVHARFLSHALQMLADMRAGRAWRRRLGALLAFAAAMMGNVILTRIVRSVFSALTREPDKAYEDQDAFNAACDTVAELGDVFAGPLVGRAIRGFKQVAAVAAKQYAGADVRVAVANEQDLFSRIAKLVGDIMAGVLKGGNQPLEQYEVERLALNVVSATGMLFGLPGSGAVQVPRAVLGAGGVTLAQKPQGGSSSRVRGRRERSRERTRTRN